MWRTAHSVMKIWLPPCASPVLGPVSMKKLGKAGDGETEIGLGVVGSPDLHAD